MDHTCEGNWGKQVSKYYSSLIRAGFEWFWETEVFSYVCHVILKF